jgi:predicted 3-demethylubiquinone-9 3-methyltransferase (glyoxalase superfamily)
MKTKQSINPCLWFDDKADEAAKFYAAVFPDSRIEQTLHYSVDTPGGKAGTVMLVDFTLKGQRMQALNGGPHDQFNDAISLVVTCKDQAEIERYWDALTAEGGKPVQCGWLKDKFGVYWPIVSKELPKMLRDKDQEKAARTTAALLNMVKLDMAELKRAYAKR